MTALLEMLLFFYNSILLIAYGIPVFLSFFLYSRTRRQVYIAISLLYLTFILDNLVIYLTEFIDWFAVLYDRLFMTVPSYKTIIYLAMFLCMCKVAEGILEQKAALYVYVALGVMTAYQMFIPIMENSAFKAWLYYLAPELFYMFLSVCLVRICRSIPKERQSPRKEGFRKLCVCTGIFAVIILIEDSFVIFHVDRYNELLVQIFNRSISEDVLRMIYLGYTLRFLLSGVQVKDSMTESAADTQTPGSGEVRETAAPEETAQDGSDRFHMFCREYQLTLREQDIFSLILSDKNNAEISDALMISPGTTKTHIHNIYSKAGVTKRRELIRQYAAFQKSGGAES